MNCFSFLPSFLPNTGLCFQKTKWIRGHQKHTDSTYRVNDEIGAAGTSTVSAICGIGAEKSMTGLFRKSTELRVRRTLGRISRRFVADADVDVDISGGTDAWVDAMAPLKEIAGLVFVECPGGLETRFKLAVEGLGYGKVRSPHLSTSLAKHAIRLSYRATCSSCNSPKRNWFVSKSEKPLRSPAQNKVRSRSLYSKSLPPTD